MHSPQLEGIISVPSPVSVSETLARLESAINAHGLTIFARIDHYHEALHVGLTMQEAQVLIFGNPRAGTPLMVASPLIALELPLKVLVWQDSTHQVWISYTDSRYLAERYMILPDLAQNIAGITSLVQSVVQQ
jgi:uncharacterized protein (DUF302 family)